MAKLVVSREGSLVESRFLGERRVVIGRSEGVDLRLEDRAVSKQHAAVNVLGNDHIVQDLGSANGTFVNDKRVDRHLLRHGDVIQLAGFHIRYVDHKSVVAPDGERTAFLRTGEFVVVGNDVGCATNLAPAARRSAVKLQRAALRILKGRRAGEKLRVERAVLGIGGEAHRAAILRRPDSLCVAHVSGDRVRVNGTAIGSGWQRLHDRDVIEVAGEQYEVRLP
jgi:ribosome-associated protein YbcJ (S4-like RNA binding protein)